MGAGRGRSRRAHSSASESNEAVENLPQFKAFKKDEQTIGNTFLYVEEIDKPSHKLREGEDPTSALVQEGVIYPIDHAGYTFPTHIVIEYNDRVDYKREEPGWLVFRNANDSGDGPYLGFQKDQFREALNSVASGESIISPISDPIEGHHALVYGYKERDPNKSPVILLVETFKPFEDYESEIIPSGGYAWGGADSSESFRVLSGFEIEDARSLSEMIVKMGENKAEFDALVIERENLRAGFNPLRIPGNVTSASF